MALAALGRLRAPRRGLAPALARCLSSAPPVVDISALASARDTSPEQARVTAAANLYDALSSWGACQVVGHGVSSASQTALVESSRAFFDLPRPVREGLSVTRGGTAWRGWISVNGEQTHGSTDYKEGLYVGHEHDATHPRVQAGTPLHGANQFPDAHLPDMRRHVLEYLDGVTEVGHALMRGVSLGLGLGEGHMDAHWTRDPLVLFRVFRYPPAADLEGPFAGHGKEPAWGIGEHSDYGMITILKQTAPGLQFLYEGAGAPDGGEWVDVPVVEDALIVNAGDLLDRITGGRLRSPRHRVRNAGSEDRLAFPCFFDPAWDAPMRPLPLDHLPAPATPAAELEARWARTAFRDLRGVYAAYLAKKVAKVFPELELDKEAFDAARGPSTRFNVVVGAASAPAATEA